MFRGQSYAAAADMNRGLKRVFDSRTRVVYLSTGIARMDRNLCDSRNITVLTVEDRSNSNGAKRIFSTPQNTL